MPSRGKNVVGGSAGGGSITALKLRKSLSGLPSQEEQRDERLLNQFSFRNNMGSPLSSNVIKYFFIYLLKIILFINTKIILS